MWTPNQIWDAIKGRVVRLIEDNRPMWRDDGVDVGRGNIFDVHGTCTKSGGVITLTNVTASGDADTVDGLHAAAFTSPKYLTTEADANLTAEVVVGTTPGGELGGTWASPTVDATHSGSAHHAAVTLGAGSDAALALAGQELTLADVLTPTEHTAIGDGAPHHAAATAGADAEHTFAGQVLSGVDAAAAQKGHLTLATVTATAQAVKLDDFTAPDDNTDLDASTTKHGLAVKATAPAAANLLNVVGIATGETVYTNKVLFDGTAPEPIGTAAAGTGVVAAHRNHVHAIGTGLTLDSTPDSDHLAEGLKAVFTANEAQAFGDVCYIDSDGQAHLADADAIATAKVVAMCADANIAADASGNYLLLGIARDDTWAWTVGGVVYLSTTGTTANTLTQTAPSGTDDCIVIVGVATHADRMYFNPQLVIVEHT